MYQTQGAVTNGMAVLVQAAMIYNLIILPLRFVYKLPVYSWSEYTDFISDRILIFDLWMSIFDLIIEDGELRNRKVTQQLFSQEWVYFLLHSVSSVDASAFYVMPFFPPHVSRRAMKFFRLPHFLTAIVPLSDIKSPVLTAAALECGVLTLTQLVGRFTGDATWGILSPDALVFWGFLLLATMSILKSKGKLLQKTNEATPKMEVDVNQDLDEICQHIIENNHMMKKIIAQETDKPNFVEAVMNKLKHETFPAGTPLTIIGDIGHHMFFLARGSVKGKTKSRSFELGSGSAFGEIALTCPMSKRTANLTTRTTCEIFLLSREGFDELRAAYPALGRMVRQEVGKYLRNDSANYVAACLKTALQCCCFVGLSFFSLVYSITLF